MRANLKGVTESTGLDDIMPEGTYKCICINYAEDVTAGQGIPVVKLSWQVAVGEHAGHEVEDALFFSSKGLRRVKSVCRRLGVKKNLEEEVELESSDFIGMKALVNVEIENFTDKTGKERQKNRVQYHPGYNEPPDLNGPAAGKGKAAPTAAATSGAKSAQPAAAAAPGGPFAPLPGQGKPANAAAASPDQDEPPW